MVDYTEDFNDGASIEALAAQGEEKNVLVLYKLPEPHKRFDGRRVSYELNYRWLSHECQSSNDEAWAHVQGSENTYWSLRELHETGVLTKNGILKSDVNLFDCFDLF